MNFRSILSKSSLKSSSSRKSLTHSDEVTKLQSEIESLKLTVDSLKVSVESRDAAIGTLAREKEKIYIELKSAQRTNRNIHQQLVDERDIHSKEKDFLINEIKRLSKRYENETIAEKNESSYEDQCKMIYDELKAKDEVIYNIGAKYMKIKSSKLTLQKKFEKLQFQNKRTCENIILLLQDNRRTLDNLLENLVKCTTVPPNSKNYLNLLQINASLHYENTQLKIYLSSKDSTTIQTGTLHQEASNGNEQFEKACSLARPEKAVTKSEGNMKYHCDKPPDIDRCTKLKCSENCDFIESKNFRYIHQTFSPSLQCSLHRSASDSCIIRKDLSELMNIN
ncbi:uncharacterized protein LOC142983409 [Anticarsia gemmatalis]|uniref:uncharacterized protein LOC142983409 n=1 Tax=Anticarsia gemmatalis TaxID=129554 RepID=UPI003F76F01D